MMRFFGGLVFLASSFLILPDSSAQDSASKLKLITGEVGLVDETSITILRKKLVNKFQVKPETKILIQTDEFLDIGRSKTPKNAIGKISDVKLGQQVTVAYQADDNKLIEIVVLRGKGK